MFNAGSRDIQILFPWDLNQRRVPQLNPIFSPTSSSSSSFPQVFLSCNVVLQEYEVLQQHTIFKPTASSYDMIPLGVISCISSIFALCNHPCLNYVLIRVKSASLCAPLSLLQITGWRLMGNWALYPSPKHQISHVWILLKHILAVWSVLLSFWRLIFLHVFLILLLTRPIV